jgi:hypothetical protein
LGFIGWRGAQGGVEEGVDCLALDVVLFYSIVFGFDLSTDLWADLTDIACYTFSFFLSA